MSFVPLNADTEFSFQNLPYGVFSSQANVSLFKRRMNQGVVNDLSFIYGIQPTKRIGVAIGEHVLDLSAVSHLFTGPELSGRKEVLKSSSLNALMSLGKPAWQEARQTIRRLLSAEEVTTVGCFVYSRM